MESVHETAETRSVPHISREELAARLRDPSLLIVNVLPREAYEAGHIPGSINLPVSAIPETAPQVLPDRSREIAVYCASFT